MRVLLKHGPKRGQVHEVPLHVARRMLGAGTCERVRDDLRTTDIERAVHTVPETAETPALDGLTIRQLAEVAADRGVTVRRGDGSAAGRHGRTICGTWEREWTTRSRE